MENFFNGERFCTDLGDLMDDLDIGEDVNLPDDWTHKVEEAELQPMFQLDSEGLSDLLYNNNDERYDEDATQFDDVTKALKQSVDFDKLNSMIPKLWYPNGKFITVTKMDIVEYVQ